MVPDNTSLKQLFDERFIAHRDAHWVPWRVAYLEHVRRVQTASREQWMRPDFQEYLWEHDGAGSIGLGKSVVITGAFKDQSLAETLWRVRSMETPADILARAQQLDNAFDGVLQNVSPAHNARRPSAKLARVFATLFPYDVLGLFDEHRTSQLRRYLGQKRRGKGFIGQQVLMREQLRAALGPVSDLPTAVDQSMFTWFLLEQIVEAEAEPSVSPGGAGTTTAGGTTVVHPAERRPLKLLPFSVQQKGIFHVSGALALTLGTVRSAEHGVTKQELIEATQEEAPNLGARSAARHIALVRGLGLLDLKDGAFRPTERGKALLDGEKPGDVLAPVLISQVVGFAHLLRQLRPSPDGLPKKDALAKLRLIYPAWTTDRVAQSVIDWCEELELVERATGDSGRLLRLTEDGLYWENGLPDDLEPWTSRPKIPEDENEADDEGTLSATDARVVRPGFEARDFADLEARFDSDPDLQNLVLPRDLLHFLHAALHALERKRLVLLTGLSGTGKTSLARAYAKAYCDISSISLEHHYLQVAVRPDWTDPTGLLGYYNPLSNPPVFQTTQTLRFLLRATENPTKPFFLCLDEMNLARVEHYFAPFLSAMEGKHGVLSIHAEEEIIDNVPSSVPWPANLFVLGTVNMDESTHAFSDKVLDRAFTFELWEVELDRWRTRAAARDLPPELLSELMPVLTAFYNALFPARRHFGYRTCDEVASFLRAVPTTVHRTDALDAAVLAKILPKIRGDSSGPLSQALVGLADACSRFGLTRTGQKVQQMRESLQTLGVVRFWA